MGMGSPNVFIKEYDLSEIVPSFKGVIGAIVIDSEKGEVNKKTLVTSEKQLIDGFGKPAPKKYGLGIYSAINFLKESNKLWVVRVDKGQTYSSALVRSKINPTSEYDEYGYVLENPVVDPIVKPLGALTADQIANYQFVQYPTTREVDSFSPPISLIDKPYDKDTVFNVDNNSPIEIGDSITFKNTSGMTRDQAMQYLTYTVINKSSVVTPFDYIKIAGSINALPYDSEIKSVKYYFLNTSPASFIDKPASLGDSVVYSKSLNPSVKVGDVVSLDDTNEFHYTISTIGSTTFIEDFTNPVNVSGVEGSQQLLTYDQINEVVVGSTISVDNVGYTITETNSSMLPKTITLNNPIQSKWRVTEILANRTGIHESFVAVIVSVEPSGQYTISIGGNPITFTANDPTTMESIRDGLIGSINSSNSGFTATAAGNNIQLVSNDYSSKVVTCSSNLLISQNAGSVTPISQKVELSPVVLPDTVYVLTVNGFTYTVTSGPSTSAEDIADSFRVVMSNDTSVTVSGTSSLIIESKLPGTPFALVFKLISRAKRVVPYSTISFTTYLARDIVVGTAIRVRDTQVANYLPIVRGKEVVPGTTDTIRVSNNDPIAEGDWIEINTVKYQVLSKWQTHNVVNTITIDSEYADQTSAVIGSEVYHVTKGDFEHHDAFLVTAKTPGEWGNKLAIAIRDSKNYEEAFWIDVYYDGNLVEEWEVARTQMRDGFGRQLFMEDKVNIGSSYIQVKNNDFMTDEDGKLLEPLKTLYYIRQPVKTPNYTKNATILETVWDGDNRIRVHPSTVANIDVTKPVMIGNNIYNIASLGSSSVGGPLDTIVLSTTVSLNLDYLPPLSRHLNIGDPVKQYFNRAEIVSVTVVAVGKGSYSIKVSGTTFVDYEVTYEFTASDSDTSSSILLGLASLINENTSSRVTANIADGTLMVQAKVAGVDIVVSTSDNLTSVIVQENARAFTNYNLQKINGAILPTVSIGSTVDLSDESYIIRDAGANRTSGGDDAGFPTIGQYLMALDSVFPDREQVDFLVILDGSVTARAYQQRLVEICEKRQDCFALLSVDFDAQANPNLDLGVLNFRRELMINSSYGALYTPWTKIYDKWNDFEIWVSPESWASRAISYISANRELWYAPAGWDNGKVMAMDVYRRYTEGERDILYDNQLNPIRFAPNKGLVIWGQKTLQTKPSALDRINVRFLLIVIERGLIDYLEDQVFKFNDEFTRQQITAAVMSFLQDIKVRRGLYDYTVVCDDSNNTPAVIDRNEMYVDVYLQPVRVAEHITARVVITRTGANFNEIKI